MIAKKRKLKKDFFSTISFNALFVLLILILGFFAVSNWKISQKREGLHSRIEELKKEIQLAKKINTELKTGISQIGAEGYLERIAKEQLGLKKPGEEVVAIVKEKEENQVPEPEKEKSIWQRILEKLNLGD